MDFRVFSNYQWKTQQDDSGNQRTGFEFYSGIQTDNGVP